MKAIGRSADAKVKAESWEDLWAMNRLRLKESGVDTKDRRCVIRSCTRVDTKAFDRYILWCMGKFRQGLEPAQFAHPPKPKKKIRGYVAPIAPWSAFIHSIKSLLAMGQQCRKASEFGRSGGDPYLRVAYNCAHAVALHLPVSLKK